MKLIAATLAAGALMAVVAACGGDGSASPPAPTDGASNETDNVAAGDQISCAPAEGPTEEIDSTKLLFEYQSTDVDTGIHGLFDTHGWSELCVYAPDGTQILAVKPQSALKDLTVAGIFFESREPPDDEVPQTEIVGMFSEGEYEVVGTSFDGAGLTGVATLTHDIPEPPTIVFPEEGDIVDPNDFVVSWEPVTKTVNGDPAEITGYEIIVTDEGVEDPNGFSQPIASIHVPPSVASLTIPSEFLQPGTEYELEVIALEESGNQTITVVFFETE